MSIASIEKARAAFAATDLKQRLAPTLRRAPQTELLVIPQCGHSPHRDQPGVLSREAGRFILEQSTTA